jgi:transcriptional regulator with XRE-family HTH domain
MWQRLADKVYRDEYVAAKIDSNLAFQINNLRESRGWTQEELAKRADTKQPRISLLERSCGGVTLSALRKIASAFDVALSIKFVPFSQLVDETISERLDRDVPCFDDDLLAEKFQFPPIQLAATRPTAPAVEVMPSGDWVIYAISSDPTTCAHSPRMEVAYAG